MTTHLTLLLLAALSVVLVSKPSFAVFLSIDCGASDSYVDENSVKWVGDDGYVHNGESQKVRSFHKGGHVFDTLRVFPTLKKNCYTINNLNKGERILMRASFLYGNYDGKNSPPTFDILLDGNRLGTMNLTAYAENTIVFTEKIYILNGKSTSLCLAQTLPKQLPFISVLELRSLGSEMYSRAGSNQVLTLANRAALGAKQDIRYPDDPYDRKWTAYGAGPNLVEVTSDATAINVSTAKDQPPKAAVQNALAGISIQWGPLLATQFSGEYNVFVNLYFSEVIRLNPTQKRSLRVFMDDKPYLDPIIPPFGSLLEVQLLNITTSINTTFSVRGASDSTLPPLLNAYEVFEVSDAPPYGTNIKDVEGLLALQTAFNVLQQWTGDPCLPSPYSWEWIECSNSSIPRVLALKLSGFGLSGSLPDFSSMDALQTIDLHNNGCDGTIPEFFGSFPNLQLLDLANNRFKGSIPTSILNKNGSTLVVTGNCLNGMSCPPPSAPPSPMLSTPPLVNTQLPSPLIGNDKIADQHPVLLEAIIQAFLPSLIFYCF